jgi:hypothetical protein
LPEFWDDVGEMDFLSGIGPDKECLLGEAGYEFMIESKKLDLAVHPWTTRDEMEFVSPEFESAEEELRFLYCKRGISGMFTENVDLGIKVGVRGCDDFDVEDDALREHISKIDQNNHGKSDGNEILEDICRGKSKHKNISRGVGFLASGVAVGFFMSIIAGKLLRFRYEGRRMAVLRNMETRVRRGNMRGMQTISTVSDDDYDDEVI